MPPPTPGLRDRGSRRAGTSTSRPRSTPTSTPTGSTSTSSTTTPRWSRRCTAAAVGWSATSAPAAARTGAPTTRRSRPPRWATASTAGPASAGCDGVDPDNVDGYSNATGFPLRAADQLAYNRFLAGEAHARGLAVGLKNDLDQVAALAADFDFAINEQCFAYDECAALAPFTRAGRSVLQIEYGAVASLAPRVCPEAARLQLFTILPGADRLAGAYRRCSDGRDVR
jgi:hypothetical protein